jgi:RES domain-containing protein
MIEGADIRKALTSVQRLDFTGVLYRAVTLEALYGFHHDPPYPAIRPLYNLGAPSTGARFTPRDGMPSLYFASDPETALAEVHQVHAKLRLLNPPVMSPLPPTVLYSARVQIDSALDLMNHTVQTALGIDSAWLGMEWRPAHERTGIAPTQLMGQEVFESGLFQAIRFPSARQPGHACWVVFTERLGGSSIIEVFDPDGNLTARLP